MKKVLALVLAVMMLSTMAFAADEEIVNPGAAGGSTSGDKTWIPGSTIKIDADGIVAVANENGDTHTTNPDNDSLILVKSINSTNYSLSSIKYAEGKNLVDSIEFNDAQDRVEIKLAQDYDNTKGKNLEMTFTLKGKKSGKVAAPEDLDIKVIGTVGYTLDKTMTISDDEVINVPDEFLEKNLYEIEEGTNGEAYGTLEFTAVDTDVDVSVRAYDGDKLYLYNNMDVDKDILKAYADSEADITFLNFPGEPTFNSTATVYFYKEEGSCIYEVKNGKLVESNAKWSDDDGAFILKTRTLGNYVFSDVELDTVTESVDDVVTNPDTGANDVVGIAAALGVVALVSAAAVSLKK